MVVRKQTVWLLTMLAVMIVLSGYYLVKGPSEQIPALGEDSKQQDPLLGVQIETKQTEQPAPDAAPVEGTSADEAKQVQTDSDPSALLNTASETFQGYKMRREAMIQQQKDEQMTIVLDPNASPQAIAEAKAKHDELSTLESNTMALEEMLKADGYKDAVVFVQNDNVKVIVQKEKLTPNEVIDIMAMVRQHLNIPTAQVTVSFQP